jgi:hypothetical protein
MSMGASLSEGHARQRIKGGKWKSSVEAKLKEEENRKQNSGVAGRFASRSICLGIQAVPLGSAQVLELDNDDENDNEFKGPSQLVLALPPTTDTDN